MYLCIDLKSFYASVECVKAGLDPMTSDLVVADESRGKGALCLAVSPSLKAKGVRNRCRLFEIPKEYKYIIAKPRMALYIEYSAKIYAIYLKYFAKEDIHPYSIDEMFIYIEPYLAYYNQTPYELALLMLAKIKEETGLIATAGIGDNLYLAKVALDILAKHNPNYIGYLNRGKYLTELAYHEPLTDFWQIAGGTYLRLLKLGIRDMHSLRLVNPDILYKEFGVNAKILIDHANGIEDCTIKDIREYKPKSNSLSLSQILFKDYPFDEAIIILKEMVLTLTLDLVDKGLVTGNISLYVGYTNNTYKSLAKQKKIYKSSNYNKILSEYLDIFNNLVIRDGLIRQIGISFSNLDSYYNRDYNLFSDIKKEEKDHNLMLTINDIKHKYGKNSLINGMDLLDYATQRKRNTLIGGHNG